MERVSLLSAHNERTNEPGGSARVRAGAAAGYQQDVAHMLWWCQLPTVVHIRQTKLQPAVVQLDDALDIGSVGSGQPISAACRVALREHEARPKGRPFAVVAAVLFCDALEREASDRATLDEAQALA